MDVGCLEKSQNVGKGKESSDREKEEVSNAGKGSGWG